MYQRHISLTGLLLATVVAMVGLPAPAHAAASTVEGESGTPVYSNCPDDGPMRPVPETGASGGLAMFFPGSECSEAFTTTNVAHVTAVRFLMGGMGGTMCGRFVISGGIEGATDNACAPYGTWVTAAATTSTGSGPFALTWEPDRLSNPDWINASLDYLVLGDTGSTPSCAIDQSGTAACLTTGSEVTRVAVPSATIDQNGPRQHVAGYLDLYKFTIGGTSSTVACVGLLVDTVTVNPCALAGGTYVSRVTSLVDESADEPEGTFGTLLSVAVCNATLRLTVAGVGVDSAAVYTLC